MDKFLAGDSIGLLISKFALLGDEDALAVVEWMTNMLYPESLVSNAADDVIKIDADIQILEDERYLDIFRMVDYSICGIELDKEKPYSKTIIIRKDENGNLFRRELQMDSTGVREFFAWAVHIFRVVYENKVVFAAEMDREHLTSEMYSLADFPDVRYETTKIYEFYMKGILGGTAFE